MDSFYQKALDMFASQVKNWSMASNNYAALQKIMTRTIPCGEMTVKLQCNPARIVSTTSNLSGEKIEKRPCFLCARNRPPEQKSLPWNDSYEVLVNPFPIFPKHFTIPALKHSPQQITGRIDDMLSLARIFSDFVLFYNGPRCGASAPDHMHFQAGNKGFLPIEYNWESLSESLGEYILEYEKLRVSHLNGYPQTVFIIESGKKEIIKTIFGKLIKILSSDNNAGYEPMMNLLCLYDKDKWRLYIFPRRAHRPRQYYTQGEKQRLISPGTVDISGVIIVPRPTDYESITEEEVWDILQQVSVTPEEEQRIITELKKIPYDF